MEPRESAPTTQATPPIQTAQPAQTPPISPAPSAPVSDQSTAKPKIAKTPKILSIAMSVLAVAGIGFGVFELLQSNSKDQEIADLKSQLSQTTAQPSEPKPETPASTPTPTPESTTIDLSKLDFSYDVLTPTSNDFSYTCYDLPQLTIPSSFESITITQNLKTGNQKCNSDSNSKSFTIAIENAADFFADSNAKNISETITFDKNVRSVFIGGSIPGQIQDARIIFIMSDGTVQYSLPYQDSLNGKITIKTLENASNVISASQTHGETKLEPEGGYEWATILLHRLDGKIYSFESLLEPAHD